MRKLKRLLLVLLAVFTLFVVYVLIVNRNMKELTWRQKMLRTVYPAFMWITKKTGTNASTLENKNATAPVSFYSLQLELNNGDTLLFEQLKGKNVLLVNTASDCGYTRQYETLQSLYATHGDSLVVIGFPANDFKEQEKGSDAEIGAFCKKNFGVSFPLAKKSVVSKTAGQHPVFQWLTDPAKNGWNSKAPSWNFSKYLVTKNGRLTHYFDPSVSPDDPVLLNALNNENNDAE